MIFTISMHSCMEGRSIPMVGIVVTISPNLSLYKMVVLPAASRPTIRIRISFLAKSRLKSFVNDSPIFLLPQLDPKRPKSEPRPTEYSIKITNTNQTTFHPNRNTNSYQNTDFLTIRYKLCHFICSITQNVNKTPRKQTPNIIRSNNSQQIQSNKWHQIHRQHKPKHTNLTRNLKNIQNGSTPNPTNINNTLQQIKSNKKPKGYSKNKSNLKKSNKYTKRYRLFNKF